MATRWSSDYNAIEIRDFDAHKMAIDYTGSIVLLAGRKKYGIVEIYKSSNILYPRSCKYEIKALEWNPTYHNQHLCALAQSTQLQLLSLKNNVNLATSVRLNTHTRAILDINWHGSDPNTLASSSMDSFVNIWDIRDNTRPALSLSAIIPASRVRWNHLTKHLIATAHGGEVKIWDQRKAKNPIHYITAHLSNIHCLDWSYTNENQLVTCSQDCTVKFFEINDLKKTENVLNTITPVWRAKYTPFGDGILIVLVPPEKRVDNNLILWNLSSINSPVHTFVGHSDMILEFQWMKNNEDKTSEYEFITWSKDQTMRLWHIVSFLQEMPMDYIEKQNDDNLDIDQNAPTSDTSNVSNDALNDIDNVNFENEGQDGSFCMSASEDSYNTEDSEEPIVNLHQEFLSLNVGSEIFIEQKDPDRRILIALVKVNNNSITIHMTFPLDYPVNVEPQFQITKSTYDASMKNKIHKVLYDSAIKQVSKNLTCVQFCLRELVVSLRKSRISFSESQFSEDDKKTYSMYSQSPSHYDRTSTYISSQDSYNILQHKTMGLKFCNNGALLWFNSPPKRKTDFFPSISLQKIDSANHTPLQKLQPYWFSNRNSPTDGSSRSSKSYRKDKLDKPIVSIYDVSSLFPINKDLASKYELDISNVFSTCLKNAWITNGFKRKDLVQTWTLAAYACNTKCNVKKKVTSSIDQINSWRNHPFTIHLIDSLISHYANHSDFQTAALLCCVFNPNPALKNIEQDRTPTPVYTRSNSLSEGFTFSRGQEESTECYEISDKGLLLEDSDSQKNMLYDVYKKIYMDVLDNLGLLDQQTSVKKFLKQQTQKSSVFFYKFIVECLKCNDSVKDGYCVQCQRFSLKCTLCNSTVRGAAHVCLKCGHGGHANHLIQWFSKESLCAVNCGCYCLFETMSILHIKRYDSKED
ncbi:GATOR complex protein WDR59 [Aphis gossypii]|nr:GATOR complex protein WDR59 [Aphis gossypii]CAH1725138.1 unnamed protein product [Aphis gossypii]